MIKVENISVWGFEHAVRAVRNPLSSWDKSDSGFRASGEHYENIDFAIGPNDLALMKKTCKGRRGASDVCKAHPSKHGHHGSAVLVERGRPILHWKVADINVYDAHSDGKEIRNDRF